MGALKRGCPQGSSLGPLLWNIYQNDLFYAGVKSQLSAYADDHQLYSSKKELRTVIDEVEKDGKDIRLVQVQLPGGQLQQIPSDDNSERYSTDGASN